MDKEKLEKLFSVYGKIVFSSLNNGTGSVSYRSSDEAQKAIKEMNGKKIDLNILSVSLYKANQNDQKKERNKISVKKGNPRCCFSNSSSYFLQKQRIRPSLKKLSGDSYLEKEKDEDGIPAKLANEKLFENLEESGIAAPPCLSHPNIHYLIGEKGQKQKDEEEDEKEEDNKKEDKKEGRIFFGSSQTFDEQKEEIKKQLEKIIKDNYISKQNKKYIKVVNNILGSIKNRRDIKKINNIIKKGEGNIDYLFKNILLLLSGTKGP